MSSHNVGHGITPIEGNDYDNWYCKVVQPNKRFWIIEPVDGSKDTFVHISAVERAGLSSLNEGQKVHYEIQPGRDGKSSAENLSIAE